ncbi:hypothetical protein MA16_Dca017419 [Dendrobium catenatum]|uniref:Uncharacterized protein n=1 Tax=Dendrobium catenatum TaxID=906689 RepID=A0A2I0X0E9_9ASPA|nr:hypothetical protein MA16_Dca017419 [Dendrobium catenatum]
MESSGRAGVMAVVVVSSSVGLVAFQIHKRLVSDFMKKVQLEPGGVNGSKPKKKVRFAAGVVDPSTDNKEYRKRGSGRQTNHECRRSH